MCVIENERARDGMCTWWRGWWRDEEGDEGSWQGEREREGGEGDKKQKMKRGMAGWV